MKIIIYFCLLISAVILNMINDLFFKITVFPNIILLLFIYIAISKNRSYAVVSGFVAGLVQDCFNVFAFGATSLIWTIMGYLISNFRNYIEKDSIPAQLILVLLAELFYLFWASIVNSIFDRGGLSYFDLRNILRILLDTILFVIFLRPLKYLEKRGK